MNNSSSNFLPYDIIDIDHPLLPENLKEINETPETRTRCLEDLRRDLKNLNDVEPLLDEAFLLGFLRVAKYDTSKALQRIISYYNQFDVYLKVYKKITFPLQKAEKLHHLTLSPYRCKDNSILMFGKAGIDYKKFTFAERFYLEMLALAHLLENPVNQICGGTYIVDFEGLDFHGYIAFTPFWLRLFMDSLVNTWPCRVKAIHVVNAPSFFPYMWNVVCPFMSKKIQNRVYVHEKKDNWRNLHAFISPEILPEKYGGKLKQDEVIDCLQNLKEKEERFIRLFAFGNIKTKYARQAVKVFQ